MTITFFPLVVLLGIFLILNPNVLCANVSSSLGGNCNLNHEGRQLNEGQSVEMHGKLYKVEECDLHRAYHACGAYLLQMVSIACEVLAKQRRSIDQTNVLQTFVKRKYIQRKLLTEACCETLCTVAEMTRYCP